MTRTEVMFALTVGIPLFVSLVYNIVRCIIEMRKPVIEEDEHARGDFHA